MTVDTAAPTTNNATNPPASMVCPITHQLMQDPVSDRDGHTYEANAIAAWVRERGTSPMTRTPLSLDDLVPNRALRDAIEEFRRENGLIVVATAASASAPAQAEVPTRPSVPQFVTSLEIAKLGTNHLALVTVTPPALPKARAAERPPCDLICVIDTSGSMYNAAIAKDSDGSSEDTGMSILDVVKHSVSTIAEMLGPNDRLALVSFATDATALPWQQMGPQGKEVIKNQLQGLKAEGSTNMWAGIEAALGLAKECRGSVSIFVLTDGCPTSTPPMGYPRTLQRCLGDSPFTVSTFGFGYNLDSAVLSDLATVGRGSYTFIPDSGLVGTVFVNATANLLATCASSATVDVKLPAGFTPAQGLLPGMVYDDAANTVKIALGTVQFGQPRHTVFMIQGASTADTPSVVEATVVISTDGAALPPQTATAVIGSDEAANGTTIAGTAIAHFARLTFAQVLDGAAQTGQAAAATLCTELVESLRRMRKEVPAGSAGGKLLEALQADAESEVALGVAAAAFDKWGKHYFRSFAAASGREQCNNFKDRSVQLYTGELFAHLQVEGEKAFLSLPVPVGTRRRRETVINTTVSPYAACPAGAGAAPGQPAQQCGGGAAPKARAAKPRPTTMNWAYNAHGGCIAPCCPVLLADGSTRRADAVRRGDVLANGVVVECVVMVAVASGCMPYSALPGGLLISAYHPIRRAACGSQGAAGPWTFPINSADKQPATVSYEASHMYSYVVNRGESNDVDNAPIPTVQVGDFEIAPFSHDCPKSDAEPVLGHDFFGTSKCRDALTACSSYSTHGVVEVLGFQRDADTHMIVGMAVQCANELC
jgi:Mg-chelatase subunit ChlD